MLMNNNSVVLLKKSIPEYLHLLNLKKTLWSQFLIEIKDVRWIISKYYPVKKDFSSKIYPGTSKEADVIWIIKFFNKIKYIKNPNLCINNKAVEICLIESCLSLTIKVYNHLISWITSSESPWSTVSLWITTSLSPID